MRLGKLYGIAVSLAMSFPICFSCTSSVGNGGQLVAESPKTFTKLELEEARKLALEPEELARFTPEMKELRYAGLMLLPYLNVDSDTVLLTISEDEAVNFGVAREHYQYQKTAIQAANSVLKQLKAEGKTCTLPDFKKEYQEYLEQLDGYENGNKIDSISASTLDYGEPDPPTWPSGFISTAGQEQVFDHFKTQRAHKHVNFLCKANAAPIAMYTCSVRAFGETKMETGVGSFKGNTAITVLIAASGSNVVATLIFQTSDPQGGICAWNAAS